MMLKKMNILSHYVYFGIYLFTCWFDQMSRRVVQTFLLVTTKLDALSIKILDKEEQHFVLMGKHFRHHHHCLSHDHY